MEQSQAIRSYRFYFLDDADHIAKPFDIESSTDAEACKLAALMLAEQPKYPSIEIWERTRRVSRLIATGQYAGESIEEAAHCVIQPDPMAEILR